MQEVTLWLGLTDLVHSRILSCKVSPSDQWWASFLPFLTDPLQARSVRVFSWELSDWILRNRSNHTWWVGAVENVYWELLSTMSAVMWKKLDHIREDEADMPIRAEVRMRMRERNREKERESYFQFSWGPILAFSSLLLWEILQNPFILPISLVI